MNEAMNDRPTATEIAEQWQGVLKSLKASISTPEITLKKMTGKVVEKMTGKVVPNETIEQFIDAASKLADFLIDAVATENAERDDLHHIVGAYRGVVGEILRNPDTFDPQVLAMLVSVFDPYFDFFGIGHVDFDSPEFRLLLEVIQKMDREAGEKGSDKEDGQ